jgi:epoxyqueuosine reductase
MPDFKTTALQDGFHLRVVPVSRLRDLRAEIEAFQSQEELNGFQKWIVSKYGYEAPELPFDVRSVIIAAVRFYSYAELYFYLNGREYKVYAPTPADNSGGDVEDYISSALEHGGYHMAKAEVWLPIKRLAVQSGLAEYGRNNITYIPGVGSYVGYAVYFTDMEPDTDQWRPCVTAAACSGCTACMEHCPTGAIRPDRFLLDNARCLAAYNEEPGDAFEAWIPPSAHHATVNCLRCQYCCPMNAQANRNTAPPISFDETETALLLSDTPYNDLPEDLRRKCLPLDFETTPGLKRNLRACFAVVDGGGKCSLV